MTVPNRSNRRTPLWRLPIEIWNKFVWDDLQEGLMRVDGLSRSMQTVLVMSGIKLLSVLLVILFYAALRTDSNLIPLSYSQPLTGRGAMIPQYVIPFSLFFLTVGWSFVSAGAIHADWKIRSGLMIVFFLMTTLMFFSYLGTLGASEFNFSRLFLFLGALLSYFIVLGFVFVRAFFPARPGFEFSVIFCLLGFTFGLIQFSIVDSWSEFGTPIGFTLLEVVIGSLNLLAIIFVIQVGFEIARFAKKATTWTIEVVEAWASDRVMLAISVGLLILLAFRTIQDSWGYLSQRELMSGLLGFTGAFVIVGLVWGTFQLSGLKGRTVSILSMDAEVASSAFYLVLALTGSSFLVFIFLLPTPLLLVFGLEPFYNTLDQFAGLLLENYFYYIIAVSIGIILTGMYVMRTRRLLGSYLVLVGGLLLWYRLTDPIGPLPWLDWQGQTPVSFWLALILIGVAGRWAWLGRLTRPRVIHLAFLSFLLLLLRQTDFIEDPFSPFLAFTGLGLIVFGIVWDLLTIGSWTNESSRALPRTSRIYLYLGYIFLSTTVISWAFSQHNLSTVELFTGGGALLGFEAVGLPMLYLFFPLMLSRSADEKTDLVSSEVVPDS